MSKHQTNKPSSFSVPYRDSSDITVHTTQTKQSFREGEDNLETLIVIPPDGGWGWMVVAASFMCNFVADGTIYTFALFMYEISDTYDAHYTTVAIANSLMIGFYYLSGPIICAMVNRFGFRIVGFSGGVIAASAFIFAPMMPSVALFLTVYGALGGLGFCMVYAPSIIALGFYFERWRAMAISIAVCGSSMGMILFPILLDGLFAGYTWIGKFRILAAASLFCCLLSLLYRPIKPVKIPKEEKKVQFVDDSSSIGSFHIEPSVGLFPRIFRRFHNTSYPTVSEAASSTFVTRSDSSMSMFVSSVPGGSISTFVRGNRPDDKSANLSTVMEENPAKKGGCFRWCRKCRKTPNSVSNTRAVYIKPTCSVITERSEKMSFATSTASDRNRCGRFWKSFKRFCNCQKCCYRIPISVSVNRPLYRDDIFFTGSLFTLPEYSRALSTTTKVKIRVCKPVAARGS